jgi:hypothetical protein
MALRVADNEDWTPRPRVAPRPLCYRSQLDRLRKTHSVHPICGAGDSRRSAIQRICPREGEPYMRKEAHTLRGLASQGFGYCPIDYMAHVKAANAAKALGQIVGIGHGHVIRRRPKTPGSRF